MTEVAVIKAASAQYPANAPFSPDQKWPEYPFEDISDEPNHVYSAVRDLFRSLGHDSENFGGPEWNPLGWLIEPGMNVVLKPNFVLSRHTEGKDLFSIVTHPSVLRAVADYCWIALRGEGTVIIADAPQYNCNWTELSAACGFETLKAFYHENKCKAFEVRDLRNYWSRRRHFPSMKEELPGDPKGTMRVNLGIESAVKDIRAPERMYGAVYHRQETIANHTGESQFYELSRTIMDADVVISVPKLKVHKKVGVTLNIKGLVGINTNKNLIVHYSLGLPEEGGDQYPAGHFTPLEERLIRTERWMYDTFLAKQSVPLEYIHRSLYWLHGTFIKPLGIGVEKKKRLLDVGNWYGNDSAWRMSVDLATLLIFTGRDGELRDKPQRRLFSVVDGIVGGDNKGPLDPDPVESAVLLGGENLLAVDIVGTRIMGLDPTKVRTFEYLLNESDRDFGINSTSDIGVLSNIEEWKDCLTNESDRFLGYRPYPGWVGHLEI